MLTRGAFAPRDEPDAHVLAQRRPALLVIDLT
jgi:hypothetical protein